MKLRNLTPHPVVVFLGDRQITIEPEGAAPRVSDHVNNPWECLAYDDGGWRHIDYDAADVDVDDAPQNIYPWVPIYEVRPGPVEGLPDEEPHTYLIVSRLVAEAATDRSDLLYPYDLVRDEQGRVVGAQGLARANHEPPAEEWLPRARALIAELTAIDFGIGHGAQDEWSAAVRYHRDYLIRMLWYGARSGRADRWHAWRSTDPSDPQRPNIAVIIMPSGLQLRYPVDTSWLPRPQDGQPDVPYDGLTRYQRRAAIARWLAYTAPIDSEDDALQHVRWAESIPESAADTWTAGDARRILASSLEELERLRDIERRAPGRVDPVRQSRVASVVARAASRLGQLSDPPHCP